MQVVQVFMAETEKYHTKKIIILISQKVYMQQQKNLEKNLQNITIIILK